jgi:hypothetical protein
VSVHEIDCTTGEVNERPLTEEEQAALDQNQQEQAAVTAADQWATVDSVRGAQLRQTDFCVEPYTVDLPARTQAALKANEPAWLAFRQALRDLPETFGAPDGDPTQIIWPTLPPAPKVAITPPPPFTDSSGWGDNWAPA